MKTPKERFRQRKHERDMDRCRHFTGLRIGRFLDGGDAGSCEAGVSYDEMTGARLVHEGSGLRLPCFLGGRLGPPACAHFALRTEGEVIAEQAEQDEAVASFVARLKAGECPECKRPVKQIQRGACVYGDCGHRLFQGKAT